MKFTNKTYDFVKWLVTIVLPGIGALYFGLSKLWDLPQSENVVGTITLVCIFLGSLIGISTVSYNKEALVSSPVSDVEPDGSINLDTTDPEKDVYTMTLDISLEELAKRDTVTFKVDEIAGTRGTRE